MTTLELEIRKSLLAEINTEALASKSESVISVLTEMLTKLKKGSSRKHSASEFCGIWKDDSISDEEIIKALKSSRTFKNDFEEAYE